jgi:Legionella pneumophila major outer membrane protein precursor
MKKHYLGEILVGLGSLVPLVIQAESSTMSAPRGAKSAIEPGEMIEPGQLPAGYNYPAAYKLSEGWDFFVTADYIFWMASQDSMVMPSVVVNPVSTKVSTPVNQGTGFNGTYVNVTPLDTTFKSGFKVGLGWQMPSIDHWIVGFEYTWYHQTFTHSIRSSTTPAFAEGSNALALPTEPITTNQSSVLIYNDSLILSVNDYDVTFKQQWQLAIDILDGKFERPYYLGTRLLVNPEAGVRVTWIEQTIRYTHPNTSDAVATTQIKYHSNNWGLGPRFAARANWFLGGGVSLVSKAGASLLFTQFNEIYRKDNNLVSTGPVYRQGGEINVLRPQFEAGLGMQWGGYVGDDSMHLDLSATYDFNMFWNQNEAVNALTGNLSVAPSSGSLYLHGLTVRAGFDF